MPNNPAVVFQTGAAILNLLLYMVIYCVLGFEKVDVIDRRGIVYLLCVGLGNIA
jgi:hypothetical protein